MAATKRSLAALLSVAILGLSVLGLRAIANDGRESPPRSGDALALHGHAPTSATAALTVSIGGVTIAGTVGINFVQSTLSARVSVPLTLTTTSADVRIIGGRLFVNSANFNSGVTPTWFAISVHLPVVTALTNLLTHPTFSTLPQFGRPRITRTAISTTYRYEASNIATTNVSASRPGSGSLVWRIVTRRTGEVVATAVTFRSGSTTESVELRVRAYNVPVRVTLPPRREWAPLPTALVQGLLHSGALANLTVPQQLQTFLGNTSGGVK